MSMFISPLMCVFTRKNLTHVLSDVSSKRIIAKLFLPSPSPHVFLTNQFVFWWKFSKVRDLIVSHPKENSSSIFWVFSFFIHSSQQKHHFIFLCFFLRELLIKGYKVQSVWEYTFLFSKYYYELKCLWKLSKHQNKTKQKG